MVSKEMEQIRLHGGIILALGRVIKENMMITTALDKAVMVVEKTTLALDGVISKQMEQIRRHGIIDLTWNRKPTLVDKAVKLEKKTALADKAVKEGQTNLVSKTVKEGGDQAVKVEEAILVDQVVKG